MRPIKVVNLPVFKMFGFDILKTETILSPQFHLLYQTTCSFLAFKLFSHDIEKNTEIVSVSAVLNIALNSIRMLVF